MEVTAKLNNLRISPRKVRLVANLIKGMDIKDARAQLKFLVKKSSRPVAKLLDSAVANAKNNFGLEENNLYISKIFVDGGQVLKRWLPRAFGRATSLKKRTSRITLILDEKMPSVEKKTSGKKLKIKPALSESVLDKKETIEDLAKEGKKEAKEKEKKRPYKAGTDSKKRIFSRQGVKKMFQRKSI